MKKINILFILISILIGVTYAQAQTQPSVRTRGTIVSVVGHELMVKTREGKVLKLSLADNTKVSVLSTLSLNHIKKGSFVGVTAIQAGPGTPLRAREVHIFPESMRGTGEGHYDWDLEPGSSMTNANVDAIVTANNGKILTLSYKEGSQKIIVPEGVPIITISSGDKSLLTAGAQIFVVSQQNSDGNLMASRILVGQDGMAPPM